MNDIERELETLQKEIPKINEEARKTAEFYLNEYMKTYNLDELTPELEEMAKEWYKEEVKKRTSLLNLRYIKCDIQ